MKFKQLFALCCLFVMPLAYAGGTYLTVSEFVSSRFDGQPPAVKTLWLSPELQQRLSVIFGHPYKSLRVRYWLAGTRSAWVLEEIGKEQPITIGVSVQSGAIEQVQILTYRESRGGEVRHSFFTQQFEGARLRPDDRLDREIDGITGATLSVRAVSRVAQAALVLAETVTDKAVIAGQSAETVE